MTTLTGAARQAQVRRVLLDEARAAMEERPRVPLVVEALLIRADRASTDRQRAAEIRRAGESTRQILALRLLGVSLVERALHPTWKITKVDGPNRRAIWDGGLQ